MRFLSYAVKNMRSSLVSLRKIAWEFIRVHKDDD